MTTSEKPGMSRWARYHRRLDCGDFCMDANTESVPEAGYFFLLRDGRVLLRTADFHVAEAAYRELCEEHWKLTLGSENPAHRVASAWGLLGLDGASKAAAAVIEKDGGPRDLERLTRARNRWRARIDRDSRLAARLRT